MVQGCGHFAVNGSESRHGNAGASSGPGGILQPGQRHGVERTTAQAWLPGTVPREALVSGQRNGRTMANRAHAGDGIRTKGAGCRATNARRRSYVAVGGLRFQRTEYAHLPGMGPRGFGAML